MNERQVWSLIEIRARLIGVDRRQAGRALIKRDQTGLAAGQMRSRALFEVHGERVEKMGQNG